MIIRYPLSNEPMDKRARPPVFAMIALQDREMPLSYSGHREDLKEFAAFLFGSMKDGEGELFLEVAAELHEEVRKLRANGDSSYEAYETAAHPLAENFMDKYKED